ncbi:hypothetical protein DF185_08025 [Marinifilum breve]|uniref:Bacteriophage abortive infection AbiH n=1 Tax=Marinifilum breve TaxID=2184082 RepID=A0A2V3ZYR8_9BACT|nr:AbiH family protein [Marinifilum breve]PXY01423.1 hypothetical protein DF185_08025 [Marinifilum breve]
MNRLIIIGNGFDLAHGLKTSFKDFIADYLYNVIVDFEENDKYNDKLITINYTGRGTIDLGCYSLEESIDLFLRIMKTEQVRVTFKSDFFRRVLDKINSLNWVDIEVEYYAVMVKNRKIPELIKNLNSEFSYMKDLLMDYLKGQEESYDENIYSHQLQECFGEVINVDEILMKNRIHKDRPSKILFLNFNYTNILMKYFNKIGGDKDVNYIHGNLEGNQGEPIFGFGDEFDKHYEEIEGFNDNEYFRHIKSFEYSKNQSYFSLMRFISSGMYQVQIYGHSCGISDRTMLNKIFENDWCKSIKIFYYENENGNDFIDRLNNISRHFKDKTILREKIVPLDMCKAMPQPKEEFEANLN